MRQAYGYWQDQPDISFFQNWHQGGFTPRDAGQKKECIVFTGAEPGRQPTKFPAPQTLRANRVRARPSHGKRSPTWHHKQFARDSTLKTPPGARSARSLYPPVELTRAATEAGSARGEGAPAVAGQRAHGDARPPETKSQRRKTLLLFSPPHFPTTENGRCGGWVRVKR